MPYYSNKTQLLQNYFDYKDSRVRYNRTSLDAQLLNVVAQTLDDSSLRMSRELSTSSLQNCPSNIDNQGVYYGLPLDNGYALDSNTDTLNQVIGISNGVSTILTKFDDLLPVPAGYLIDTQREVCSARNPIIASMVGTLTDGFSVPDIKTAVIDSDLDIYNNLSFWYTPNGVGSSLDVVIYGRKYPVSPWNQNTSLDQEIIQVINPGYTRSIYVWQYVYKIVVRNLGQNEQLDVRYIDFNLPADKDPRSTYLGSFRDEVYDTYWTVDPSLVKEQYMLDGLSGLVDKTLYKNTESYIDIAIEPNTWGGLLLSPTSLAYFDRRERQPNYQGTGIKVDPFYGLDVQRNLEKSISTVFVDIYPIAYKLASGVSSYRYVVIDPSGTYLCLIAGGYVPYNAGSGWISGKPQKLTIPLTNIGQYTFILECIDGGGNKRVDVFPYLNSGISTSVLTTFNLSPFVSTPKGVAYDFLSRIWLWDGSFAIPIKPYYNGYVLDADSRTLYLTDNWDSVEYS